MFLFMLLTVNGININKTYANHLTLSLTSYENKVVIEHCQSYNACFWITEGWSRIDWYVNGIFYNTDYKYGMSSGDRNIIIQGKVIDCSNLMPGSTVTISARAFHHDAFTYLYIDPDMVQSQTLSNYTNVSNVLASDGLYMTKVAVNWSINELFNNNYYSIQNDGTTISGQLPAGSTSHIQSGLEPGTSGDYRVESSTNDLMQISSTDVGSTFDPNMHATDNLENSISLTWNNTGETYQANGFLIDWYNEDTNLWELLWERDDNIYYSKTDNGSVHTLIPGYKYQYRLRVKPVDVSDVIAYTSGKTSPNGIINGYVRTPIPNQVPVSGVQIIVELIGDTLPTDTTTTYITYTNSSGYYEINNIYYHEEAEFLVTPIYEDRIFDPANSTVTLNTNANSGSVDFTDLSSFTISGTIISEACPVSGVSIIVDNETIGVTDVNGEFSVTVSSGGTYSLTPYLGEHLFDPSEFEVIVSEDVAGVNFSDTTVYLVEGYIAASCNAFIGQGDIRFFSMDDNFCFDQTVTTDENGYYSIHLPSSIYRVNVSSFTAIEDVPVSSNDVMTYFSEVRIFDISEYNEEIFHGDTTEFDLIYRLEPTLTMGGLSYVNTCTESPVSLVRQYEPSLIEFTANEEFNENICPASDGYILIRENVSSFGMGENIDTLFYEMGQTIEYLLTPGTPNLIEEQNFGKFFQAILVRDNQTDTINESVVVLGHTPRDLNYTTITPEMPFHIIHNPPGDVSNSFLEEGQSISSSFSQSFLKEGSVDTYVRAQLGSTLSAGISIGIDVSLDIETQLDITTSLGVGTGGLTESASLITTTMSQEYQTSGNVNITGTSGDVYIGGAMNMLYGITDVLEYNFTSCEFELSQTLLVQPYGIETTFMFTESHIINVIIPELQSKSDYYYSIEEEDSASFFANELSVWQQFVDRNHETIENATEVETVSISGGVGYTNTLETSSSNTSSFDFNFYIDSGVAVEAGIAVGGSGIFGGVAVNGRFTWGRVFESDTSQTTTTGYYIGDDDEGDDYFIQVLNDDVYGVPAFKLLSGQSSCPWEEGTVSREGVQLSSESTYQNVAEDESAVFILQLANTSQTDEEMTYDLVFELGTNEGGAVLTTGGSPVIPGISSPVTIPAWESVDVTVTVEKGPIEYDYNGLKFTLQSQCDEEISDEVYLNVHFYREYDLDVVIDGAGSTNIGVGTCIFPEETVVNLYAIPEIGHVFDMWVIGSEEYMTQAVAVTMDSDKMATAYFVETTESQYSVNISKIGNGLTTPPVGEYMYNEGTELELIANPTLYNAFMKWTVNGEEINEAITDITITENTEIIVEFIETHQLNVLVSGEGTSNLGTGFITFNHGSMASLFASPALGYIFEKWNIDGTEIYTQYLDLTMNDDITATAYFIPTSDEQFSMSISYETNGGYTIPPSGDYLYLDNSNIELTAVPEDGFAFDKWIIDGNENTNNPVLVNMLSDINVETYFEDLNTSISNVNKGRVNTCSIFPNPSIGNATITSMENIKEIRVLDITGKIIDVLDAKSKNNYKIELESYKSGIYILNVETESRISTLKMNILK